MVETETVRKGKEVDLLMRSIKFWVTCFSREDIIEGTSEERNGGYRKRVKNMHNGV